MPVKKFGIYLGYGPTEDLRSAGLGRFLGEFLRASRKIDGVELTVVAPSWLGGPLQDLLGEFYLDGNDVKIVTPRNVPVLLRIYSSLTRARRALHAFLHRQKEVRVRRSAWKVRLERFCNRIAGSLLSVRSPLMIVPFLFIVLPSVVAAMVTSRVLAAVGPLKERFFGLAGRLRGNRKNVGPTRDHERGSLRGRIQRSIYKLVLENELTAVASLANKQGVSAWYVPAAFWPQISQLSAPKLVCVPDIVFRDFPTGFASPANGGIFALENFERIRSAIGAADHLVTYSEHVKNGTLVAGFHVPPSAVTVITHGANRLDRHVTVNGFADNEEAGRVLARAYLRSALAKCRNSASALRFFGENVAYLFYASQFRPNKNVLMLLRAYKDLRRQKLFPHKLILTGDPVIGGDVSRFLNEHQLHDDVYCLRGLSEKELAACYKLADLAINPSLSEGGMPFTFTEAISVGTPVIMGDIEVSREIITDERLRSLTFFDGNDPKALTGKIMFALENAEELYQAQREFYETVSAPRTWENVTSEYVAVLGKMSENGVGEGGMRERK